MTLPTRDKKKRKMSDGKDGDKDSLRGNGAADAIGKVFAFRLRPAREGRSGSAIRPDTGSAEHDRLVRVTWFYLTKLSTDMLVRLIAFFAERAPESPSEHCIELDTEDAVRDTALEELWSRLRTLRESSLLEILPVLAETALEMSGEWVNGCPVHKKGKPRRFGDGRECQRLNGQPEKRRRGRAQR